MSQDRKCNSTDCDSNCEDCSSNPQSFIEKLNDKSSIKRVIGVVSGKGGVGKSLVTSMLSVLMNRKGYKVGIMDSDITGPSIPKIFGIESRAKSDNDGKAILPENTHSDIKVMSINLLLEDPESPVVWRGPVIAGAVKQFWTDVVWGDLDYLFIDMPPGTGDVPLTVFQSIPLDGIVIVTSPQDLVSLIVKKAYNMAKMMNIPVIGIVENMSYVLCPDCSRKIKIFGDSKISGIAQELGIPLLAQMPIDTVLAELCDKGEFERFNNDYLVGAADIIESTLTV